MKPLYATDHEARLLASLKPGETAVVCRAVKSLADIKPDEEFTVGIYHPLRSRKDGTQYPAPETFGVWGDDWDEACPFGPPGTELAVKEAYELEVWIPEFGTAPERTDRPVRLGTEENGWTWLYPHYRATDPTPELCYDDGGKNEPRCKWRYPATMPQWAIRTRVRHVGTEVVRAQAVTGGKAGAMGYPIEGGVPCTITRRHPDGTKTISNGTVIDFDPVSSFARMHAKEWKANAHLWLATVERI